MNYKDIIIELMAEIPKQIRKKPALSREKADLLASIISLIEPVTKTSYCDGVDLSVSESCRDLEVTFFGADLEVQDGRKNPFFQFAVLADHVDIRSEEDVVHVTFSFQNIWELMPVE